MEAVDSPSCSHSQSQTASDGKAACPLSHCADALPTDVLAPWPSTNRVRAWTDARTCHRQEVTCSVQTLFCHKEHLASTDLLHNFVQARSTRPEPRGVSSEDGRGRRCAATPRRVCARRRRARPERGVDPGALQVQRVHRGIRQQRVDRLPRLRHATPGGREPVAGLAGDSAPGLAGAAPLGSPSSEAGYFAAASALTPSSHPLAITRKVLGPKENGVPRRRLNAAAVVPRHSTLHRCACPCSCVRNEHTSRIAVRTCVRTHHARPRASHARTHTHPLGERCSWRRRLGAHMTNDRRALLVSCACACPASCAACGRLPRTAGSRY